MPQGVPGALPGEQSYTLGGNNLESQMIILHDWNKIMHPATGFQESGRRYDEQLTGERQFYTVEICLVVEFM